MRAVSILANQDGFARVRVDGRTDSVPDCWLEFYLAIAGIFASLDRWSMRALALGVASDTRGPQPVEGSLGGLASRDGDTNHLLLQ